MSSSNAPYLTAVNCSVGLPLGQINLDRATALGVDRIELWWPWATPEPGAAAVDELVAELRRRELTLVALNFWGGDTAAGERGVLHQEPLTPTHLDAHARLAELTGADRFNLLVGRGGRDLTSAQRDRTAAVAEAVTSRGQGTVLIEPSRSPGVGPADYPVQVIDDATALTDTIGGTGLLADFWHLVETVGHDGIGEWIEELGAAASDTSASDTAASGTAQTGNLPTHVQIADDPGRGAPGTGELPLADWVAALHSAGYVGDVAGEWVW